MPAPLGDSAIGKVHFLTSYVWRFWDRSRHFFELLMCAVPIYWDLRQFGICRHFCRGCGSSGDLQYPGYYQRVDRYMIHFAYPSLSKGLLAVGSMVRFPVYKGYYGKPAHHIGVSTLSWLLISKVLNPRPEDRDALGLITIYPRPDEHQILLQHSADADRSPTKKHSSNPSSYYHK